VENRNVSCSVGRSVDRHARWAKMRRSIVPGFFAVELAGYPVLVAGLTLLLSPSALTFELALLALGLQCVGALLAHTTLGARRPLLLAALEPLRVLAALACWCLAATSRRVSWRGNVFEVGAGSRLVPVAAEVEDEIAVE
jgi:ceramide glucosyltransferase